MDHQIPKPNTNIAFYPFEDGAVLHLAGANTLWVLNAPAATLFCLLDGERNEERLTHEYGCRFDLHAKAASNDVRTLLDAFSSNGLLKGDPPLKTVQLQNQKCSTNKQRTPDAEPLKGIEPITFCASGHWFSVQCSHEQLSAQWLNLIKPLVTKPDPAHSVTEIIILPDQDGSFCSWQNKKLTGTGLQSNNIIPHLVYQVFDRVCHHTKDKLLLHAAVIAKENRVFILPAKAGSGKSTIAAALSASGWTLMSDELAIINTETLKVEPYPMAIGLKSGSIAKLVDYLPNLQQKTFHTREDGRRIHYHMPNKVKTQGGLPIAALIFPQYSPNATPKFETIPPLIALQKLAATGSSERPLTDKDIKALLTISQKPAHDLIFNNLKTATKKLQKTCAKFI